MCVDLVLPVPYNYLIGTRNCHFHSFSLTPFPFQSIHQSYVKYRGTERARIQFNYWSYFDIRQIRGHHWYLMSECKCERIQRTFVSVGQSSTMFENEAEDGVIIIEWKLHSMRRHHNYWAIRSYWKIPSLIFSFLFFIFHFHVRMRARLSVYICVCVSVKWSCTEIPASLSIIHFDGLRSFLHITTIPQIQRQ